MDTACGSPTLGVPEHEMTLEYWAPVYIVVTCDANGQWTISKIVVDDESTDFSASAAKAYDPASSAQLPDDDPLVAAATAFVERSDIEFPAWQFGW